MVRCNLKKWVKMKHAKKLFPNEITVMKHHDFLNMRVKKSRYLNREEKSLFESVADFQYGNLDSSDLLVKRVKDKINIGAL